MCDRERREQSSVPASRGQSKVSGADRDDHWMRRALALADDAGRVGEVPVGAVLVRANTLVGVGRNGPIGAHDPSAHAEVVCLRDAARRSANYRLPGTTLYVTLEPCAMCAGAIIQARVSRVVFGASDPRAGVIGSLLNLFDLPLNHRPEVLGGVLEQECAERLKRFFRDRRGQRNR